MPLVRGTGGIDEYFKPYSDSHLLVWEKPEAFPLKMGARKGSQLMLPLFDLCLEVLDNAIRQENRINCKYWRRQCYCLWISGKAEKTF